MKTHSAAKHSRKERINFSSFFEPHVVSTKSLSHTSSKETTEISINNMKNPESPIKKGRKFMTCSEINNLIDSLVSKKDTSSISSISIKPSTKLSVYNSNDYKQITPMTKNMIERRKKIKLEMNAYQSNDYLNSNTQQIENRSQNSISYINSHSKAIVNKTIDKEIKEVFGDSIEITKQELEDIFHQLGILEGSEKISDRSVFREILQEWEVDHNIYDAVAVQTEIFLAVNGDIKTNFRKIVRDRINTKLVNKKQPKMPYVKEETYQGSHVISNDVFERINSPKPPPLEEDPVEIIEYSKNSKRVLNNSVYGKDNFLKRMNYFDERKKERTQKIIDDIEDEFEKQKEKEKVKHIVHYQPEQLKSKLYYFKKEDSDVDNDLDYQTKKNKPHITPYKEYCEYRDLIRQKHQKEKNPPGWESHFQRMQDGRIQKILKKKEEEKNLEIPIVKMPEFKPRVIPYEVYLIHNNPPQKKIDDLKPISKEKIRASSMSPRKRRRNKKK